MIPNTRVAPEGGPESWPQIFGLQFSFVQSLTWLRAVVQGHFSYYAVPGNLGSLGMFRERLLSMWWHVLCRRSQKRRVAWERIIAIAKRWLPSSRVLHPYPTQRFAANHPK